MSNAIGLLLQPERQANETQDKYKARRTSAKEYVKSSLAGTLYWNTDMQGKFISAGRKTRPVGKSGHRISKKIARLARNTAVAQ